MVEKIAKLVCNHKGWISPSGIDCKSAYRTMFEARGFGFEEWLFRGFHQYINGEKYYLGWIQAFNNMYDPKGRVHLENLYLSTTLHRSAFCQKGTSRLIGKIENVTLFSTDDFKKVDSVFFDFNGEKRDVNFLKKELKAAGFNYEKDLSFNIKFKKGYRYNVPGELGRWSQLECPGGFVTKLPPNFNLSEISTDSIQAYLDLNGNIPLILP